MKYRPLAAVAATGALTLCTITAGSTSASAATLERCTISTPVGDVHVAFFTQKNGLTKSGFVQIFPARQPVLLWTDRVAWQRGAVGPVVPGHVRQWAVKYPVAVYTHATVRVKTSASQTVLGCVTR